MSGGAYVIDFQYPLGCELALHAQEVVVDVGVANALRQDDSGQNRDVGVEWSPAGQVAGGLRAYALSGVGWRAGEGRYCAAGVQVSLRCRR